MSNLQRKILSISCFILGISLIIFMIIFTPCFTELIYVGNRDNLFTMDVIVLVFIPLLSSLLLFSLSYIFKVYTTQDMINNLEKGFKKGTMSLETYKNTYRDIMLFDAEQKKIKQQVENEINVIKQKSLNETKAIHTLIETEKEKIFTKIETKKDVPNETKQETKRIETKSTPRPTPPKKESTIF